jgi:hypothetical protein
LSTLFSISSLLVNLIYSSSSSTSLLYTIWPGPINATHIRLDVSGIISSSPSPSSSSFCFIVTGTYLTTFKQFFLP